VLAGEAVDERSGLARRRRQIALVHVPDHRFTTSRIERP
jgi:hypothetical protein